MKKKNDNIIVLDFKNKSSKIHSFDTNILSNFSKNGAKGVKGIKKYYLFCFTK